MSRDSRFEIHILPGMPVTKEKRPKFNAKDLQHDIQAVMEYEWQKFCDRLIWGEPYELNRIKPRKPR